MQELQLAIIDEDPTEDIGVVEDEERGLKHLVLNLRNPCSSSNRGFWTCQRSWRTL